MIEFAWKIISPFWLVLFSKLFPAELGTHSIAIGVLTWVWFPNVSVIEHKMCWVIDALEKSLMTFSFPLLVSNNLHVTLSFDGVPKNQYIKQSRPCSTPTLSVLLASAIYTLDKKHLVEVKINTSMVAHWCQSKKKKKKMEKKKNENKKIEKIKKILFRKNPHKIIMAHKGQVWYLVTRLYI